MAKIKIALAEDNRLFREAMSYLVEHHPDWKDMILTFAAENGKDLIEKLKAGQPDVILMDLKMPEMNGIEATRYVSKHYPEIRIVVQTKFCEKKFIIELIKCGAHAYLFKSDSLQELNRAIRIVMQSEYYYNEHLSEAMVKGMLHKKRICPSLKAGKSLSARQLEVLKLICKPCSTAEIATKLNLSTRTIDGYRKELYEVTGTNCIAGLVIYAIRNGIVEIALKLT